MAITLRILFHDTQRSHSLLSQLQQKSGDFVDTALEYDPDSLLSYHGLIGIVSHASGSEFYAPLDDVISERKIKFEDWWGGIAFRDQQRNCITRRELVLSVADKDGGAHVDPHLDAIYADLTRNNSLGWQTFVSEDGPHLPITEPHRFALRQIAHEVLKSLKPNYAKKPQFSNALFTIGGMKLVAQPHVPGATNNAAGSKMGSSHGANLKVGRNAPCPCGSGNKFKRCHGKWI